MARRPRDRREESAESRRQRELEREVRRRHFQRVLSQTEDGNPAIRQSASSAASATGRNESCQRAEAETGANRASHQSASSAASNAPCADVQYWGYTMWVPVWRFSYRYGMWVQVWYPYYYYL